MESDLPHTVYPALSYVDPKYIKMLDNDPELREEVLKFANAFGCNASGLVEVVGKSVAKSVEKMIKEKYPNA